MLSAYLFDQSQGQKITEWPKALRRLEGSQVLWLDLLDASAAEELEIREALGL